MASNVNQPKKISKLNTGDVIIKLRGKDFHPEFKSSWSSKRLADLKLRKTEQLRMQKTKRSAMGEYIPSHHKNPLAVAALPTPSAFDYYPNIEKTLKSNPKYTIARKFRVWKKKSSPGPAQYGKLENFYTSCKAYTLKARSGFTHLDREKKYQKVDPSSYVLPSTLSSNAAVVSSRLPATHNVGMLPSYPYPPAGSQNTAGFYGTQSTFEKGVKFGIIPKPLTKEQFPGPIYDVSNGLSEGLKFQLLPKLPWPPKIAGWDAPAPNTYLPKSELGKSGKFARVNARLPSVIQGNKFGPGANRYQALKPTLGVPKTMSHFPLPSRFPRQPMPAPNSYLIEPLLLPKKNETYIEGGTKAKTIVKGPSLLGRPDSMITLRHSAVKNQPPPSIHLCYFKKENFGKDSPSARIRSKPVVERKFHLAPNSYHPCTDPKLKRIPAYTFGHKITSKMVPVTIDVEPRPLPSTLKLKHHFTFGIPLTLPVNEMPSPSKYAVPSTFACLKSKPCPGASLKSRQTPFAHPGIANIKTPVPPTRLHHQNKHYRKKEIKDKIMN